jgi:hypothetical protein
MPYRNSLMWLLVSLLVIGSCGPETIFLRPALDTPDLHVNNGHRFLALGKLDAAAAEFTRAKKLNDAFVPAYVGIALVQGHQGDVAGGFETLKRARELAATTEELQAVEQGFDTLKTMQPPAQK